KPKLFDKRRFRPRREDLVLVDELLTWARGVPRKTFQCNNVEFVTDYPGFGRGNRQVYEQVESLFKQAKRKILIETPYFITMDEGQRILTDVEAKGVDVTVLTNSLHS